MKNTHTPGPWRIGDGESSRVYLVNGPDGAIGEVVYADARNPADARLIAAAPDLLAALEECVSTLRPYYRNIARAAIAKARGEA